MAAWITKRPVVSFYVLAFGISWLGSVPQAAYSRGLISIQSPLFVILGNTGPAIAALIVAFTLARKRGVRDLLAPLLRWKIALPWYCIAILWQPALLVVVVGLGSVFNTPMPNFARVGPWYMVLPIFLITALINVWEEVGWRGFALPRLQLRYNALVSSLIVGILWGVWHLPLFLDTTNPMSSFPFIVWYVGTLASAVLYTWLYNNTRGSLLLVTIFHAAGNVATGAVFLAYANQIPEQGFLAMNVLLAISAVAVVAIFGPARLARAATT